MLSNRLFMTALFNIASSNTVESADFCRRYPQNVRLLAEGAIKLVFRAV